MDQPRHLASSWSVLGMSLDPKHRDDVIQPLDALVILKGLDSSGRVAYWITSTEGLSNMEVLGMTTWAAEVAIQDDDGD